VTSPRPDTSPPASPDVPTPVAVSVLLADVLDGPVSAWQVVHRSPCTVHLARDDDPAAQLCLAAPGAVRLPRSVLAPVLPACGRGATAYVGGGGLRCGTLRLRPRRWWRPPRPEGLPAPAPAALHRVRVVLRDGRPARLLEAVPSLGGTLDPAALVGAGPGTTPAGDDLLAGALIAGHANADPRLAGWRAATRARLHRTTAVSSAMLHDALAGWATAQLAGFVTAVCRGGDVEGSLLALLRVGHTSGAACARGALHAWESAAQSGAAA
jgi:hypothetical protein